MKEGIIKDFSTSTLNDETSNVNLTITCEAGSATVKTELNKEILEKHVKKGITVFFDESAMLLIIQVSDSLIIKPPVTGYYIIHGQ